MMFSPTTTLRFSTIKLKLNIVSSLFVIMPIMRYHDSKILNVNHLSPRENVHICLRGVWTLQACTFTTEKNKKLSYCWETVRRESMPRIAEMDVEMTTQAEMTFKSTSRSSKVAPIESQCTISYQLSIVTFAVSHTVFEKFDVKQSNDLEICLRSLTVVSPKSCRVAMYVKCSETVNE